MTLFNFASWGEKQRGKESERTPNNSGKTFFPGVGFTWLDGKQHKWQKHTVDKHRNYFCSQRLDVGFPDWNLLIRN